MRLSGLTGIGTLVLAAMLSAPAWAANTALPGTLNYVEGRAALDQQTLNAKSVGSVTMEPGQTITTDTGKAEVLLTPGVFLRMGDNSAVTMDSPSLTNTKVSLDKGTAMVEVDDIHKANMLQVRQGDATTQLMKTGLYQFDSNQGAVRVFKGQAQVDDAGKQVDVKGGHELDLNAPGQLKTRKFDKDSLEQSDLYRFSSLRSEYLAEANTNAATIYVGGGWYGPGWYWDPFFTSYTWLPGNGFFYSPFGWGFYSPAVVWRSPFYGGYYHGYAYGPYRAGVRPVPYGSGTVARPVHGFSSVGRSVAAPAHFGVMGGGFHGGTGGFHGGGRGR